jgi:hypothetical protein
MQVTTLKLLFVTTLASLLASRSARAASPATCDSAFDQSQVKRDEGDLIEARRLLRVCGGPRCSPTQQKLCAEWLTDVDARMPSFVLSAKDGSGGDIGDVSVQMDGVQVATTLDGRAMDANPGLHAFVFERADGTKAEVKAIAEERGKGKVVSVHFEHPPAPAAASVSPLPPPPPAAEGSSLKTAGVITGAVGGAGLAVGAVFGALAFATKDSHCTNDLCDPGTTSTVHTQGDVSTFGFIAGGILIAGGVTMFLVAPKRTNEPATIVAFAPMVAPSAGGIQVAGRW